MFTVHTDEPQTHPAITREQAARSIGCADTSDTPSPRISALWWLIPVTLFWAVSIAAVIGAMTGW